MATAANLIKAEREILDDVRALAIGQPTVSGLGLVALEKKLGMMDHMTPTKAKNKVLSVLADVEDNVPETKRSDRVKTQTRGKTTKRRGRPKGKKDTLPRKRRSTKSLASTLGLKLKSIDVADMQTIGHAEVETNEHGQGVFSMQIPCELREAKSEKSITIHATYGKWESFAGLHNGQEVEIGFCGVFSMRKKTND